MTIISQAEDYYFDRCPGRDHPTMAWRTKLEGTEPEYVGGQWIYWPREFSHNDFVKVAERLCSVHAPQGHTESHSEEG